MTEPADRLAEIKARRAAITPIDFPAGGWIQRPHGAIYADGGYVRVFPCDDQAQQLANGRFITAAPDDIDWLVARVTELEGHIADIDAHATPYGDLPDDPGYVGTYLLSAGALHRALGKLGHTAPSCQAEARVAELEAELEQEGRNRRAMLNRDGEAV